MKETAVILHEWQEEIIRHCVGTETFKKAIEPDKSEISKPAYSPRCEQWRFEVEGPEIRGTHGIFREGSVVAKPSESEIGFTATNKVHRPYAGNWPKPGGTISYIITVQGIFTLTPQRTIECVQVLHEDLSVDYKR